jgi:hypothetical protein
MGRESDPARRVRRLDGTGLKWNLINIRIFWWEFEDSMGLDLNGISSTSGFFGGGGGVDARIELYLQRLT